MDLAKTVWMGNINNYMDENSIRNLIKPLNNKIVKINIMRRNNNINGFALIEFNSNKTAKYFIKEYNNKKINGHLFCLNWAKNNYNKNNKENKEKEISNSDNQNNKYFTIYVGNLDISIDEQELTKCFQKTFKSVVSSRIIRESNSGKSRGFGFVNFTNFDEYNELLKHRKDSLYLKGRILAINRAYQRNKEDSNKSTIYDDTKSNITIEYKSYDPNDKLNLLKNEYIYIPGYIPIPLSYLYQQQFNKKEKYQESNSVSQISTASEGEHNIINNNNIYNYNSIMPINKGEKKEEKINLKESIKKGIENINQFYNSNRAETCPLSLACYYHCNIALNANEEFYLNMKLNEFIKERKENMKKIKEMIDHKNIGNKGK